MNDWFEAEQRIERAQQLSESQRFEEALAETEAALAIHPGNAAWHAQRGALLEELDRFEDSAEAYEKSLELDAEDHEVAAALGVVLARLGHFARALIIFDEMATKHPEFEPAYCHRIGIYAELGRHEQAEEMFYLAQQLNDECPYCFYNIACSLASRGQVERAIFCWKRVLEIEPDYPGVNRRIAQAHRSQGRHDRAREYYLRELRQDPGNTDLMYELAELSLACNQPGRAVARLSQILELEPEHEEAQLLLGSLFLERGQLAQARRCFENLVETGGESLERAEFFRRYGETLFRLKEYRQAKKQLLKAAHLERDDSGTYLLLGGCELAMERTDRAAEQFRRAVNHDNANALAHQNLGLCLLRLGRSQESLAALDEAVRLQPELETSAYYAVLARLQIGRWKEARSKLAAGLRTCPDSRPLRELRGRFWRLWAGAYLRRAAKRCRRLVSLR